MDKVAGFLPNFCRHTSCFYVEILYNPVRLLATILRMASCEWQNEMFAQGPVAQLAEQLTLNQQVEGSSPSRVIDNKSARDERLFVL